MFATLKPSSKHSMYISSLTLLVPRISFAKHKQTPPPQNKKTVFATLLQSRFGFHPCRGLDAGDVLTLSQQRWTTFGDGAARGGLDGTSFPWRQKCTRSCGNGAEASEGRSCCGWRQIELAPLDQMAEKVGSQVFEDEGCHGGKSYKRKQKI